MIYLYFEIGILSHQRLLRKDFQNNFVANFADVARNNVSRKERKVLIISRKGRKVSLSLFYCLFLAKFAMLRKVLQYFLLIIIIIISWRTWRTWRDILFFSLAKVAPVRSFPVKYCFAFHRVNFPTGQAKNAKFFFICFSLSSQRAQSSFLDIYFQRGPDRSGWREVFFSLAKVAK